MLSLTFLCFATATLGALNPALIHREVSLALAPHSQVPRGLAHGSSLHKRAPNTSALATIISLAPSSPQCSTPCAQFTKDLSECAKLSSQSLIASCACSTTTLGDSRSCASCISLDSNTSASNATAVVSAYNSFVDLCSADGLASVTGTVVAGASTATQSRPAATPTTNSAVAGRISLSSISFSPSATTASASLASLATSARLTAATVLPVNSAAGLRVGAGLAGLLAAAVVLV